MNTPSVIAAVGAALAVGVALGWSLRPKPDGAALSSGGDRKRGVVSALESGAEADGLDDAPDPFRSSAPTPERLMSLWRAKPSRARALEFELAVLQMDAAQVSAAWENMKGEIDWSDWETNRVLAPLFKRWGAVDTESAMAAAEESGEGRNWMMGEALSGLAQADVNSAIGWAKRQEGSDRINHIAGEILDEVSKTDPARAVLLFKTLAADGTIAPADWSSGRLFERWAREDPRAAAEAALDVSNTLNSPRGLQSALSTWGRRAPKEALAWLADQEGVTNASELSSSIIGGWADDAPEAAADFVLASGNKEMINSALGDVLREWIEVDFDAAGAWVDKIEDVEMRQEAELKLVESSPWSGETDDTLAFALARIDTNPKMADKLQWAVWRLANENPEKAIGWAEENLTDPAQRAEMVEGVLRRAAWDTPSFTAQRLGELPTGKAREDLYQETARGWARDDLEAARGWVNGLPEGEDRDRAVVGVTQQWLEVDIEAAGEWVAGLEPGPVRDQLTYQHALAIGGTEKDPLGGLALSRDIADPHLREEAMERVYQRWLGDSSEAAAARAAIEADTTINEGTRWRLLNPP